MLHKLQKDFKEFVMNESANAPDDVIENGISVGDRLEIYRNNIFQNLTNALKITYPKFVKLVGEEFFNFLGHKYISKYLPSSGALLEYGSEFPEFLKSVEEINSVPYASDFAKLERLHHECHHCFQCQVLTQTELVQQYKSNPGFAPKLRNDVKILYSPYNLIQLWRICEVEVEEELVEEENYLLIYKVDQGVRIVKIEENEFKVLYALEYDSNEVDNIDAKTASELILKYLNLRLFKK